MPSGSEAGRVYLALDVGDARIGVAISRSGLIAEPLSVIERRGRGQVLDAISALVDAHAVTDLVLGLPVHEDGGDSIQTEKVRAFGRSVARRLPRLRLHLQDERYSSIEAADIRREVHGGLRAGAPLDRLAAAVILRDFLTAMEQRSAAQSRDEQGAS